MVEDKKSVQAYRELFWKFYKELDDTKHLDSASIYYRLLQDPSISQPQEEADKRG